MSVTLTHPEGEVSVEKLEPGKNRIKVTLRDHGLFMPKSTWDTAYPVTLIERIMQVKGPAYLCNQIMRDEDPMQIQREFEYDLLSYVAPEDFSGRRILDFACGCGASSMVLMRMFPKAEVVGVDLQDDHVAVARSIAAHYGFHDVKFLHSPDAVSLPDELGDVDYVVMSAVYEHLLPHERMALLPKLWEHLKPQGILFINQTPNRLFPLESHTTGLPLINYLPDGLTLTLARRFSKRVQAQESWEVLLRRGIRGGTVPEIMRFLSATPHKPVLLRPSRLGIKDHVDLWFRSSSAVRWGVVKRFMIMPLRGFEWSTGLPLVPALALAIRKGS